MSKVIDKELELIKLKYGEEMMRFCRTYYPTTLETEGKLFTILSKKFDFSKTLFKDISNANKLKEFKNYIDYFANENNTLDGTKEVSNIKATARELLDKKGYILYECKTEEDIQSFKKYYAKDEELCTFNGGRLDRCLVFFAVKKNVDEIKREDFETPDRQDLYGTSVISIQFEKDMYNSLSIKNRYNHAVEHPDSTFSNNLENIIPGLTEAFNRDYVLNLNSPDLNKEKPEFNIDSYIEGNDGKYYKYNYEIDNVYYCPNNIIIDNLNVKKYDKDRFLIFDNYILDTKEKTIDLYDYNVKDGFIDTLGEINKVEVKKAKGIKQIIVNNNIIVNLDNENNIISYKNDSIKELPDYFMTYNRKLELLKTPNVGKIGDFNLCFNQKMTLFEMEELKEIGNRCLMFNDTLNVLNAPNLEKVGDYFLSSNKKLKVLNTPNLKEIGSMFIIENNNIDFSLLNLDSDCYENFKAEREMFMEEGESYDQAQSSRSK